MATKASIQREFKALKEKYLSNAKTWTEIEAAKHRASEEIKEKYGEHWRKSKIDKLIIEMSNTLPRLTEEEEQWMFVNTLEHKCYALKNGKHSCMDCGHKWEKREIKSKTICPNCLTKLDTYITRQQKFHQWSYCTKIDTIGDYQVVRLFKVNSIHRAGSKAKQSTWRLAETFIDTNTGKSKSMSCIRGGMYGYYNDNWYGDFTLRNNCVAVDTVPNKYLPKMKIHKKVRRNGLGRSFYGIKPATFIHRLLTEPKFETLLKSKQIGFLKNCHYNSKFIKGRWSQVKILIRNNYKPKDIGLWQDYVDALEYLGKDILSPHYLCPEDLKKAHDYYIKKMAKKKAVEREIAEKERLANDERLRALKPSFLQFEIKIGDYTFKTLNTEEEYKEEGEELKHCVHDSEYIKRPQSICLSIRFKGDRMETAEFNIEEYKVVQCRGYDNDPSEHNEEIMYMFKRKVIPQLLKHSKENQKQQLKQVA